MEHVLKNRIDAHAKNTDIMHLEQGGFCTGRGTFELFYILRCRIEEQARKNGTLYLAFLHLQKAFDKVIHNLVL